MHDPKSRRNLLRRPAVVHQMILNSFAKPTAFHEHVPTNTARSAHAIGHAGRLGLVANPPAGLDLHLVTRESSREIVDLFRSRLRAIARSDNPFLRSIWITARSSALRC